MQSTVDLNWHYRFKGGLGPRSECLPGGGGKNYSYATGLTVANDTDSTVLSCLARGVNRSVGWRSVA